MRPVSLAIAPAAALVIGLCAPMSAQTPTEAYQKGCSGCHASDRAVLRRIPRGSEPERRAWIEKFMAQHPCERDDLKPLIIEYLLDRSGS